MKYKSYMAFVDFDDEANTKEHHQISIAARKEGKSLNAWVKERLTRAAI